MSSTSTISTFTFEELADGSAQGDLHPDGTARRRFKLAWSLLPTFSRALIGGFTRINDSNSTYAPPDEHPDFAGRYCYEATYEGIGVPTTGTDGQMAWNHAIVTAMYKKLDYDPKRPINELYTEDLEFGVDVVTLPNGSYQTSGSVKVNEPIKKILPTITYTIRIKDYPNLPGGDATIIAGLLGKVNSAAFKGAAAKKVLFLGARASRTTTTVGAQNWQIEYKFAIRSVEWTKVFVKSLGAFTEVTSITGGNALYESADLTTILPR